MKKKIMKVLSVMLAVVLTLTAAPLSGFVGIELPEWLDFSIESSAATTSGTCGENITWDFDESTGTLAISGTGEMDSYSSGFYADSPGGFSWGSDGRPWDNYSDKIKEIIINKGITTIGNGAFADCDNLIRVSLPDSTIIIGEVAFASCRKLTDITIPNSVKTIGNGVFCGCDSLTNIIIPDSVTSIGDSVFHCCDNLTNISVDDNNKYYSSDVYGVLFNKAKTNLIHYPKGSARTSYTVPSTVVDIDTHAFACCDNLTNITISEGVVSIGYCAFALCENIEIITIPASVTTIGEYAFIMCDSLISILVNDDNTKYSSDVNGVLFNKDKTLLIQYPSNSEMNYTIPNSTLTIGDYAFFNSNLVSITIPYSVISIGVQAFGYISNLADVYFLGTHEQWNRICIGEYNTNLTDANIHFNSSNDVIKGSCGENVTWELDNATGVLAISGSGAMYDFSPSENPWLEYKDNIKKVIIGDGVTSVGDYAFYFFENATELVIGEDITKIGEGAFFGCRKVVNLEIPALVSSIEDGAFGVMESLVGITVDSSNSKFCVDENNVLFNKSKTKLIQYPIANSRTSYIVPNTVQTIAMYAFNLCQNLTTITINDKVTKIELCAFWDCMNLKDVYYSSTKEKWNTISVGKTNDSLLNATIHYGIDIYGLGEETYNFSNFSDSHSSGHCFGMSMTSAGYYNNYLDITSVGGNAINDVYGLPKTFKVLDPICHYQEIQGSYSCRSTVAGGNWYFTKDYDITSDWNKVVNYVKNHQYDNKGTLQIGYRNLKGGHAINFLRYEVVDGQERIYAYDNNFTHTETYFYMHENGYVYQEPEATFKGAIHCICLRDVNTYFSIAGEYDKTRCIYGDASEISVVGATAYPMECGNGDYTMFELPEEATETVIIPLVDNATFQYVGEEYAFGEVDENTVGKLVLSTEESGSTTEPEFIVEDSTPEYNYSFYIQTPSRTEIRNRDTIVLHAIIDGTAPEGSYIKWDGEGPFSFTWYGRNYNDTYATAEDKGYDTITATLYDADGNVLATDYVDLYSKSGFFDKIGGFFRMLFGTTKTYDEY